MLSQEQVVSVFYNQKEWGKKAPYVLTHSGTQPWLGVAVMCPWDAVLRLTLLFHAMPALNLQCCPHSVQPTLCRKPHGSQQMDRAHSMDTILHDVLTLLCLLGSHCGLIGQAELSGPDRAASGPFPSHP